MDSQKPCLINSELFGRHATYFESAIVPLWQEVYDSLVSRAHISEGSSVLDVGTGTGEVALRLGRLVGQRGQVVAIDAQTEMLQIATSKAQNQGLHNIEFKQMPMEAMALPDGSFESIVGNYSLCCCMDYKASLAECLRVTRPGGRLTYNHTGPLDSLASQVIFKIFEGYKTRAPSKRLKEIRASNAAQVEAVEKYRDPFVTLNLIRSLGYDEAEATVVRRVIKYKDASSFIDEWLSFDWRAEAEEIPSADLKGFRKEVVGALSPLSKGPKFSVASDMVFFTALKR